MYSNYRTNQPINTYNHPYSSTNNDERFIGGGFLGPFVLGGITGGLLAPAFYPRPNYGPGPMYCPYPPCYGPYYR